MHYLCCVNFRSCDLKIVRNPTLFGIPTALLLFFNCFFICHGPAIVPSNVLVLEMPFGNLGEASLLIAKQLHQSNLFRTDTDSEKLQKMLFVCVCYCDMSMCDTPHCFHPFLNLILCFFWFLWSLWTKVGHKNTLPHKTCTDISTVFLLRLPFLLSLTRLPDLLPLGQQGPSAMDHSGGGLQRSTVHRHRTFLWADLRVPTHRSHRRGLGRSTRGPGCYHWTQRWRTHTWPLYGIWVASISVISSRGDVKETVCNISTFNRLKMSRPWLHVVLTLSKMFPLMFKPREICNFTNFAWSPVTITSKETSYETACEREWGRNSN